ncbi:hypothetical protein SDC9_187825 [bioreactor metagenome]|uniref:Toxin-antitoxin biofilm protein TabA n=1 Tax=bioreactor metagenome TaxID=1076179 RepID=A0A645HPX8_9ZZZZ
MSKWKGSHNMIVDRIENMERFQKLSGDYQKALSFLAATNFTGMETGKYTIPNSNLVYFVIDFPDGGKEIKDCVWEGHHTHTDVHFIASGIEKCGYANISAMKEVAYDKEKDFATLEGTGEFLTLSAGMVAVTEPQDIHMPAVRISGGKLLRRVVVKLDA